MTGSIEIRSATREDAPAIQTVARESWHAAYDAKLGSDRVDETVSSWYDPERVVSDDIEPTDRPVFVAKAQRSIVGFVEAIPDDTDENLAHLYRIYVTPDYWGNGVGTALLERIESTLRSRGFEQLNLSVMAANDVGVQFYESRGFERTATTQNEQLDIQEYEYRKAL